MANIRFHECFPRVCRQRRGRKGFDKLCPWMALYCTVCLPFPKFYCQVSRILKIFTNVVRLLFPDIYFKSMLGASFHGTERSCFYVHHLRSDLSWALSVFFNFFTNKKLFLCFFYQVYNLFLHQSYLKTPLRVKLT